MENVSVITDQEDEKLEMPPGFRFHPTDEELITYYLSPKVLDSSLVTRAIGEVDLNKVEPWDLPWRAKMGEKEWYFFCVRDRKYPTGLRTNRATEAGYWKATGKDREIFRAKTLVGMKKTLVFYKGRAPRGEKTNWVMHEYRLEGKNSIQGISRTTKNEWVICRVFKKSSGGKKIHISGLDRPETNCADDSGCSELPPLMDLSSDEAQTRTNFSDASHSHVTCFSSLPMEMEEQKPIHMIPTTNNSNNFSSVFSPVSAPTSYFASQSLPYMDNLQRSDSILMQDSSILKLLFEDCGAPVGGGGGRNSTKIEVSDLSSFPTSFGTDMLRPRGYGYQDCPIPTIGQVDLDYLWNY